MSISRRVCCMAIMITWLKTCVFLFRGPFNAVYVVAVNGEVEPKQMLEYWREIIRYTPGTSECVQESWMRYAARRVNTQGQHFEHFVMCCRLDVTPRASYITIEWAFVNKHIAMESSALQFLSFLDSKQNKLELKGWTFKDMTLQALCHSLCA